VGAGLINAVLGGVVYTISISNFTENTISRKNNLASDDGGLRTDM